MNETTITEQLSSLLLEAFPGRARYGFPSKFTDPGLAVSYYHSSASRTRTVGNNTVSYTQLFIIDIWDDTQKGVNEALATLEQTLNRTPFVILLTQTIHEGGATKQWRKSVTVSVAQTI